MLLQFISELAHGQWAEEGYFQPYNVNSLLFCSTILAIFYLWRFTRESGTLKAPPLLPGRIPVIGHALSFLQNSEALIQCGKRIMENSKDVFTIVLLGRSVYVLTDPNHVSAVLNDTNLFEFSRFFEKVLSSFGISQKGARQVFTPQYQKGSSSQRTQSVRELAFGLQVKQTSGNDLRFLAKHITSYLANRIAPVNIDGAEVVVEGTECISLKTWANDLVSMGIQDAYFGPKLAEIDSALPKTLRQFTESAWLTWYGVPWFLRRKQHALSIQLRRAHEDYLRVPQEDRPTAAWFTKRLETEYRKVVDREEDIAALMHFFHWGVTTNTANISYWMLTHILFDSTLTETIRKEILPAFRPDGTLDNNYLMQHCPMLESVWFEVLRLYATVTTVRSASEDTHLGRYDIKKGDTLLYSARQMVFDPEVFGTNHSTFDPTRFYQNPELQHAKNLRPFGGGRFLCPGRHLAKHVAASFVAIVLRKYAPSLAFPQSVPKVVENKPAIGILESQSDVYITLQDRES